MIVIETILKIIMGLTPIIVGLGVAYINRRNKARDDIQTAKQIARDEEIEKKQQKLIKLIVERLDGLDNSVGHLENILRIHVDEDVFITEFKETIRAKTGHILQYSNLKQKYKNLLSFWSDMMEEFGLYFYKNKHRHKDIDTLGKHLTEKIEVYINDFYIHTDSVVEEMKSIKGKRLYFSKFLKDYKLHNKSYLLKDRLAENGLDNQKLTNIFKKYIDDFSTLFMSAVLAWDNEEDEKYNKEVA